MLKEKVELNRYVLRFLLKVFTERTPSKPYSHLSWLNTPGEVFRFPQRALEACKPWCFTTVVVRTELVNTRTVKAGTFGRKLKALNCFVCILQKSAQRSAAIRKPFHQMICRCFSEGLERRYEGLITNTAPLTTCT